jgi:hypothetical protein
LKKRAIKFLIQIGFFSKIPINIVSYILYN